MNGRIIAYQVNLHYSGDKESRYPSRPTVNWPDNNGRDRPRRSVKSAHESTLLRESQYDFLIRFSHTKSN